MIIKGDNSLVLVIKNNKNWTYQIYLFLKDVSNWFKYYFFQLKVDLHSKICKQTEVFLGAIWTQNVKICSRHNLK